MGINFREKPLYGKVSVADPGKGNGGCRFRGFIHGIAAFFNGIKRVGINVRMLNQRKPQTFIPTKITHYMVTAL